MTCDRCKRQTSVDDGAEYREYFGFRAGQQGDAPDWHEELVCPACLGKLHEDCDEAPGPDILEIAKAEAEARICNET